MRYIILLLFCFLMCGCRVSFVNMANVSGYETALDSTQQKHVRWVGMTDTLSNSPNDGCIYAIDAGHLRSLLELYPQCLVYLWTPTCSGNKCLPLSDMQHQCKERDIELFVVATSFYGAFEQNMSLTDHPVLIASERIYGQNKYEETIWQFVQELIGTENYQRYADSLWTGKFMFQDGIFVGLETD